MTYSNAVNTSSLNALILIEQELPRFIIAEALSDAGVKAIEVNDVDEVFISWVQLQPQILILDSFILESKRFSLDFKRLENQSLIIPVFSSSSVDSIDYKTDYFDLITLPIDEKRLKWILEKMKNFLRIRKEREQYFAAYTLSKEVDFQSEKMFDLALDILFAAREDVATLVVGKRGCEKSGVVASIVSLSARANAPFVTFNCADYSANTLEQILFGSRQRQSVLKKAQGGTLYLANIDTLELSSATKLLRVLADKELPNWGGKTTSALDVRIIASSRSDLKSLVRSRLFPEELYARLTLKEIKIPPLIDRPDDIGLHLKRVVKAYCRTNQLDQQRISDRLSDKLKRLAWNGNVREIYQALWQMLDANPNEELTLKSFEALKDKELPRLGLKEKVGRFEKEVIRRELEKHEGNRSETAKRLGIGRVTLLDKIKRHGL